MTTYEQARLEKLDQRRENGEPPLGYPSQRNHQCPRCGTLMPLEELDDDGVCVDTAMCDVRRADLMVDY